MSASDRGQWTLANQRYLAASLRWLRLRLEEHARRAADGDGRPDVSPSPGEDLALAAAEMEEAEAAMDPPPALAVLSAALGLSSFERQVLLLCAGQELDGRVGALCAAAHDRPDRAFPSFSLAFAVLDSPAWDVLSPDRPLRQWRLVEIAPAGAEPLTTSPLRVDERVVHFLTGVRTLDERLAPLVTAVGRADEELPASQRATVDAIVFQLDGDDPGRSLVVPLSGRGGSKRRVAAEVARALGYELFRMPAHLLPAPASDLDMLARLWDREHVLARRALLIEARDVHPGDGVAERLEQFLSRGHGLVFLDVREGWGADDGAIAYEVSNPTPAEQQAIWAQALPPTAQASPALLAGQFDLEAGAIRRIALEAAAATDDGTARRAWDGCLRATRPRLDALAQRIAPHATSADIVLPEPERALLLEIARQVANRARVYDAWGFRGKRSRGFGIAALFAGDSGTGKTMAAEVIASELRLDLYRIDLSQVVSKYIGETEKNLRKLFDAAEDGGAILFFDEADALFGKRTEVRDSHDRYANIEVNYLLQRMEDYRGLAVLATNMKKALDPAFMRRLRFVVQFPQPGPAQRRAIWARAFPAETPVSALDLDLLAQLNLTGGNIAAIALNAAFSAAHLHTPVTMALVLQAAQAELRKLGRPAHHVAACPAASEVEA
jgi:ATPase family protein associated with various cellular activities (AAA)/winged helix domain-containing protein